MKAILAVSLVLIMLTLPAQMGTAQTPACKGQIIDAPGVGLPVKFEPTWFSGDAGVYLAPFYPVTVFEVSFTPATGELWMRVSAGWVQAYSGYTTGRTQIMLNDYYCSAGLPYRITEAH